MNCPDCQKEIPEDSRLCPYCGVDLQPPAPETHISCPDCQREIPEDSRLCPYCGTHVKAVVAAPVKLSGMGVGSIILGLLAAILWWFVITMMAEMGGGGIVIVIPLYICVLVFCVLGIVFGAVAYFKKEKDPWGLIGFVLCTLLFALFLGFFIFVLKALQMFPLHPLFV